MTRDGRTVQAGNRALLPGLGTRHPLGAQLPSVYAEDDFVQRFTAALDDILAPVLCTLDSLPAYFDPALAPADFLEYLAAWVGAPGDPDQAGGADQVDGADQVGGRDQVHDPDRPDGADQVGGPDQVDGADQVGGRDQVRDPDRPDGADQVGGPDQPSDRRRAVVARAAALHALRGTRAGLAAQLRLAFGAEPEIEESGAARWSARPGAPLPGRPEPRLLVRLRVADPAAVDPRAVRELVAANRPAHLPFEVEILPAAPDGTGGADEREEEDGRHGDL